MIQDQLIQLTCSLADGPAPAKKPSTYNPGRKIQCVYDRIGAVFRCNSGW